MANGAIGALSQEYTGDVFLDDSFNIPDAETVEYTMVRIVNLEAAKKTCDMISIEEILSSDVMVLEQY